MSNWEIQETEEFQEWFGGLSQSQQVRLAVAIEVLEEDGPAATRPLVDTIKGSKHKNMKELRRGTLRVLFAFDPERQALLLIGGDKRDRWERWYREAIPVADKLFDEHLSRARRRK